MIRTCITHTGCDNKKSTNITTNTKVHSPPHACPFWWATCRCWCRRLCWPTNQSRNLCTIHTCKISLWTSIYSCLGEQGERFLCTWKTWGICFDRRGHCMQPDNTHKTIHSDVSTNPQVINAFWWLVKWQYENNRQTTTGATYTRGVNPMESGGPIMV